MLISLTLVIIKKIITTVRVNSNEMTSLEDVYLTLRDDLKTC